MVGRIERCLVKADQICDYIPGLSTANNLIDLFQKCVVIPMMKPHVVIGSHYYTHIQQKSLFRCIALLIPVLGNVVIALYNLSRPTTIKDIALAAVRQNGLALGDLYHLGEDFPQNVSEDLSIAAIQENPLALEYIGNETELYSDIVMAAVLKNGLALEHAGHELQQDKKIVMAAVKQNGLALEHASLELRQDLEVIFAAVQQNGLALGLGTRHMGVDHANVVEDNGYISD